MGFNYLPYLRNPGGVEGWKAVFVGSDGCGPLPSGRLICSFEIGAGFRSEILLNSQRVTSLSWLIFFDVTLRDYSMFVTLIRNSLSVMN